MPAAAVDGVGDGEALGEDATDGPADTAVPEVG